MKKLMVMAATATMAVAASAATVTWGTAATTAPKNADGDFGTVSITESTAGFSNQKMYVWIVDSATDFNDLTADSIYSTYYSDIAKTTGYTYDYSKAASMGKFTQKSNDVYNKGETVYAAIIMTFTDDKGKDWYIANKASGTIGDVGGEPVSPTVGDLSAVWGGTGGNSFTGSGTAITGWTAVPVPEPTSGLLLLLGVAGLALRRRRA